MIAGPIEAAPEITGASVDLAVSTTGAATRATGATTAVWSTAVTTELAVWATGVAASTIEVAVLGKDPPVWATGMADCVGDPSALARLAAQIHNKNASPMTKVTTRDAAKTFAHREPVRPASAVISTAGSSRYDPASVGRTGGPQDRKSKPPVFI
jgi:hypothetical protein